MEGAIDIRLVVSLASTLVAIGGAAAVGRMQIKQLIQQLADIEARLRATDRRIDGVDTETATQEYRLKVLATMSSPENKRRDHMLIAGALADISYLKKESERMSKLHNGVHKPVPNVRTAE